MAERYPLSWPAGWKRTMNRKEGRFRRETHTYAEGQSRRLGLRELTVSEANDRVLRELRTMRIVDVVVSTNLQLNTLGFPRGGQKEPADPGVAVYWEQNGKPQCMAIDQYDRVADNLAAIAASLGALRAIERHGGAQIMERAFLGFAALPEKASRPWREVFHVLENEHLTRDAIEASYRALARKAHPDNGGTAEKFQELTAARDAAFREIQCRMNLTYTERLAAIRKYAAVSKLSATAVDSTKETK